MTKGTAEFYCFSSMQQVFQKVLFDFSVYDRKFQVRACAASLRSGKNAWSIWVALERSIQVQPAGERNRVWWVQTARLAVHVGRGLLLALVVDYTAGQKRVLSDGKSQIRHATGVWHHTSAVRLVSGNVFLKLCQTSVAPHDNLKKSPRTPNFKAVRVLWLDLSFFLKSV